MMTASNIVCQECCDIIVGLSFQCVDCRDHIICSQCITSGKHPQHAVFRNTKVDRDTVAKLMAASVKVEKMKSMVKELKATLEEQTDDEMDE